MHKESTQLVTTLADEKLKAPSRPPTLSLFRWGFPANPRQGGRRPLWKPGYGQHLFVGVAFRAKPVKRSREGGFETRPYVMRSPMRWLQVGKSGRWSDPLRQVRVGLATPVGTQCRLRRCSAQAGTSRTLHATLSAKPVRDRPGSFDYETMLS